MDRGDSKGSIAFPSSENGCYLMGFGSYLSDSHSESVLKSGMPAGLGLEDKGDNRSSALEVVEFVDAQEAFIKEEYKNVEERASVIVAEDEQDDFPGLSPLRGDCVMSSSDIGTEVEAGYMSRMFEDGTGCIGCENFLFSSRVDVDGPLIDANGNLAKLGDGFCCLPPSSECTIASETSNRCPMEGKNVSLSDIDSYKSNTNSCSGDAANLVDRKKEETQLFSFDNGPVLPLQYARKLKETHQVNNFAHSHKKQLAKEQILGSTIVEHEPSCSAQGSTSERTDYSAVERSILEKLSYPSTSFVCCSIGTTELDTNISSLDSFKKSSTFRTNDKEFCADAETVVGAVGNSSLRRTNPKRGASLRSNLADGKFYQLNTSQSNRGKCRRMVGASTSHEPITLKMFDKVRRKTRNSHRLPRLSVWGMVENLLLIIKQRDELNLESNAVKKRRSTNAGSGANKRKAKTALKNKQSRLSSSKAHSSSCRSIPLIIHETQASIRNGIEHFMGTSNCHTTSETSSTKVELDENYVEKWYSVVGSNVKEGQQGERDLESTLTQEISADNLLSESHEVSPRADLEFVAETIDDKRTSNAGHSPESDVCNPLRDCDILTGECSTLVKLDSALHQSSKIQVPKREDGLLSTELNFIEPFVARENRSRNPKKSQNGKKKLKEKKRERENKVNKENKGKKTAQVWERPFLLSDPSCVEERPDCLEKSNEVKKDSLRMNCCVKDNRACKKGGKCSKYISKHCKRGSKSEKLFIDSSVYESADLDNFNHRLEIQNKSELTRSLLQNDDSEQFKAILPSEYVNECQFQKGIKKGLYKNKSSRTYSTRQRRKFMYGRQKDTARKSDKFRMNNLFQKKNDDLGFSPETANNSSLLGAQLHDAGEEAATDALLKDALNDVVLNDIATSAFGELSARELYNVLLGQSSLSGKKAWALCDDCQKWRCVPDELVHVIEKNKWTCKDNVDEAFADCAIPQEKTDDDINNDLGISVEDYCSTVPCSYGEPAPLRSSAAIQNTWTRIKSNLFLHRNRRTLTIDEMMVCHCKLPPDGSLGCGEECLNRMLNIECVKGTCPCGNLCSNQQFQKRKYAKFKWINCGKKGYGLQLEESASKGQFLIEYVGEVLDLVAYEERLRSYACRGHKHFYFMTLNGGEVIDACSKGNLGRYVNHSCDPNCRTEKWMVNGEVCVGLFAIRDIKKGEEITFDYNYVRVFGAAAKKCVCGSIECRGYIGGDPSSSEVIVQDDSDADDLEPVMIEEYGDDELGVIRTDSDAIVPKLASQEFSVERNDIDGNPLSSEQGICVENKGLENQDAILPPPSEPNLTDSSTQSSNYVEYKDSICRISEEQPLLDLPLSLGNIKPDQTFGDDVNEISPFIDAFRPLATKQFSERSKHSLNTSCQSDHVMLEPVTDNTTKISSQNSDSFMHKNGYATSPIEEILIISKPNNAVKALQHVKIKRSRVSVKTLSSGKTKKVSTAIGSRHIEGVEEKLNELLDEDGGIRRQKDAAKGYLKLLVVTAAAGDGTSGSMSQSARDLSLILDAILKTKSRMVLVDIINKNGLQMLHNMMKQNCDNFNRIPILRKLLRVLEFLAEKEILTTDHIYSAPPYAGMESFKESMLKLMKHRDSQVLHIARNFADQWIPRNYRRVDPSDRDGKNPPTKHLPNNWCQTSKNHSWEDHEKRDSGATISGSAVICLPSSASDFQGDALSVPPQHPSGSVSFADNIPIEGTRSRKRKSRWDQPADITISDIDVSKQKSEIQTEGNNSSDVVNASIPESVEQNSDDDGEMPPGFESASINDCAQVSSTSPNATGEVVIGYPLERYLPHLTVSYGIPLDLMHLLGIPETDASNRIDPSWKIAPAMPFKPFPPLPSYPRNDPPCSSNIWNPSFNGNSSKVNGAEDNNFHSRNERAQFSNYGNGRRFFKPRQWNNQRPPRCGSRWSQGGNGFS